MSPTIFRYILRSFVFTFALTLGILTFVMSFGAIVRVMHLLSRDIDWWPVVRLLLHGVPSSLTFSVPVSALTAALLVFGRLSADGETVAMKASGIPIWHILYPPLLFSVLLSALCYGVNAHWAPASLFAQYAIRRELATTVPLKLLSEGRVIREFVEGLNVYIGSRDGTQLSDIRVWDAREGGAIREISARSGAVITNAPGGGLRIELRDVTLSGLHAESKGPVFCERWSVEIPAEAPDTRTEPHRAAYMTTAQMYRARAEIPLRYREGGPEEHVKRRMQFRVEMNKRAVLAVSCMAFVFLGVPLGIQTHRKESSAGVGISLFLVFNFYLFVIVAESLNRTVRARPDLIVWLPVVLAAAMGLWLSRRAN